MIGGVYHQLTESEKEEKGGEAKVCQMTLQGDDKEWREVQVISEQAKNCQNKSKNGEKQEEEGVDRKWHPNVAGRHIVYRHF